MSSALINPNLLRDVCGEDTSILKELMDLFLEQGPLQLRAIEEALQQSAFDALKTAAHTLKGSVSYMGAERMLELAKALEEHAKHQDSKTCHTLLEDLKIAFSHTQEALKVFKL